MNESTFLDICHQASTALGLPEPERLGRDGRVDIDGVAMVVFFDELTAPDQVRCFVDLGPVPTADGEGHLRQLLNFNLFSVHPASGVCALDPVSGHGLLVFTLPLPDNTTGAQWSQALQAMVAQALALREAPAEGSTQARVAA
ncbi:MAG: CesT family type III secretion system chaperone [Hydrogenophaga sp.]|uniref:CesT family type III secretion system chaperone n=1 Tax=Hydrogenophaga sp. TaxID=1904254 RepID=UPI001D2FE7E6|nr:CesT family type III secretion system chaperone [Hydrogenophaga sp.]MBX3609461.1 CesT family type III secretion system chaperone [Hydrogenophaga sp.]